MQPPTQQQGPQDDEAIKAADDAKAAADAAKQEVIDANEAIREAQKEVDAATKALKKVEDDTIDTQPDDSAVGKARDAYRAAEKKYQEARMSGVAGTRISRSVWRRQRRPTTMCVAAGIAEGVRGHAGNRRPAR